jgi:hypothetical protein
MRIKQNQLESIKKKSQINYMCQYLTPFKLFIIFKEMSIGFKKL